MLKSMKASELQLRPLMNSRADHIPEVDCPNHPVLTQFRVDHLDNLYSLWKWSRSLERFGTWRRPADSNHKQIVSELIPRRISRGMPCG